MQFGAPTICSNTTSMPEVAGDAAIMLSPQTPDIWTQNMLELAQNRDKRQKLGLAAQERARRFDWEHSARSMLTIYENAVRSPKRINLGNSKIGHAQPKG
jgi:glycosyltransferase involved in cell wall biosynthesis